MKMVPTMGGMPEEEPSPPGRLVAGRYAAGEPRGQVVSVGGLGVRLCSSLFLLAWSIKCMCVS